ncbi:MAG TPA: phage minor head protein [Polyangia bacterium]|nr:phage minor head protein [Polyangia bacterium]
MEDATGVTDDPVRFDEAIAFFRQKVPVTDEEWKELVDAEKKRAFKVAAVSNADLIQDVFDAIDSAIADGTSFEEFKQTDDLEERLYDEWGASDAGHLETVFRTNVLSSYNGGRHEIFSDPDVKEDRPYWRFELIDDDRICDECEACDGVILPVDDPWWSKNIPPLHFQCRCSFTALTHEEAVEEGVAEDGPTDVADDGFGAPPSADDWEPDTDRFDDAIAAVLRDAI